MEDKGQQFCGKKVVSIILERPDGQDWIGAGGDESIQRVLELFAKYPVGCKLTLKTEGYIGIAITRLPDGLRLMFLYPPSPNS